MKNLVVFWLFIPILFANQGVVLDVVPLPSEPVTISGFVNFRFPNSEEGGVVWGRIQNNQVISFIFKIEEHSF
jgi:hypothetical protein